MDNEINKNILGQENFLDVGSAYFNINGLGFLDNLSCMNFNDASSLDNFKAIGNQISSAILASNDHFTISSFIFATFVGMVGALSAYLFTRFHWEEVNKKEFKKNIGDILINSIQELEYSAVKYWIHDYKELTKQKNYNLEISIKTNLRLIRKYIKELGNITNKKTSKKYLDKLEDFEDDIYDLITGGNFESKNRISSKADAIKISFRCSAERAKIFIATH